MTPEQARAYAAALIAAADKAEAEGRNLVEADMDIFSGIDDKARDMLQSAIEAAREG